MAALPRNKPSRPPATGANGASGPRKGATTAPALAPASAPPIDTAALGADSATSCGTAAGFCAMAPPRSDAAWLQDPSDAALRRARSCLNSDSAPASDFEAACCSDRAVASTPERSPVTACPVALSRRNSEGTPSANAVPTSLTSSMSPRFCEGLGAAPGRSSWGTTRKVGRSSSGTTCAITGTPTARCCTRSACRSSMCSCRLPSGPQRAWSQRRSRQRHACC